MGNSGFQESLQRINEVTFQEGVQDNPALAHPTFVVASRAEVRSFPNQIFHHPISLLSPSVVSSSNFF